MSNEVIIHKIGQGDQEVLKLLYRLYRNDFIIWAQKKTGCREDDAKDIFQEVIVSFYLNVQTGSLQTINSSIKTYLFTCGKNLLLNELKKTSKLINLSGFEFTNDEITKIEQMEKSHYDKELIKKTMEELPIDCQKILILYYFENCSLKTIAKKLGYKNANVVKTMKSESMKKMGLAIKRIAKNLKMLIAI